MALSNMPLKKDRLLPLLLIDIVRFISNIYIYLINIQQ